MSENRSIGDLINEQDRKAKEIDKLISDLFHWLEENDPDELPTFFKVTLATKLGLLSNGIDEWTKGNPIIKPEDKGEAPIEGEYTTKD